jgi:hypothetical protein
VLSLLERTRERLTGRYEELLDGLTIVLHDSAGSLALSNPVMPLLWGVSTPTARRYLTGWAGTRELHVLASEALRVIREAIRYRRKRRQPWNIFD